ncbi:MAG: GNAT family N-acetyltransferase [Candidatus Eremiobacteraeota bacterium]|nr:GNAT family N-acetyltransferase [Candidatus Eremiobacteraeota bacterium]
MRTIRTENLRLEPVTPVNAAMLWDVLQEPDLRDYQDLPDLDLAQFARAVASRPTQLRPGIAGRFEWLVYLERDGTSEPAGWVSLRVAERNAATAEVGYSVVRQYRGRGIATEAVGALVDEGFRYAELRRIRAYCVPENASSRRVLERTGFEDEGMLPHGATVQGQPVDVIAYALERDRWEARSMQNRSAIES